MNDFINKYVSFEKNHIIILIASFILVTAHIIHIYIHKRFIFQILFIISYVLFVIGIIKERKKINIVTLINKVLIILLVMIGMYLDYKLLKN